MVRFMMAQTNLPITYWGDTLLTNTYVLNRVPSKSVTTTLYKLWAGRKPDLHFLKPWSCAAYIYVCLHEYGQLGPRGKKRIFIRYSEQSKGYVFIGEYESGGVTEFESGDIKSLANDFPKHEEIGQYLSPYETQDYMNPITSEHSGLPNSSGRNLRNDDELVSYESQNDELVSPESPLLDQSGSDVHDPSGSDVHDPSGSNLQDLNEELVPQG